MFFDPKKAFDIVHVDNDLNLEKIAIYDITGVSLRWVVSYLLTVCKCIVVDVINVSSNQFIKSGCPRVGVRTRLVLILINDIPLQMKTETEIYAVDTITHAADECLN